MSRTRIVYDGKGDRLAEFKNGELVYASEEYERQAAADYHVMPDFEPFVDSTGTLITGRAHWREHVRRHDAVEMGASDLQAGTAAWDKRKAAAQERYSKAAKNAKPVELKGEPRPIQPSRLSIEIANRLHNRPAPDRKTLVQLALSESRRLNRR